MKFGIDISHWNRVTSLNNEKIDFVIIKAMEFDTPDKELFNNIDKCNKAGKPYAIYIYSRASVPEYAREEARAVLKLVAESNIKPFAIFIDIEEGYQKPVAQSIAIAFTTEIEKNGFLAGAYMNASFWKLAYSNDIRGLKWIARYYNDSFEPFCSYLNEGFDIYQYTSKGTVVGIENHVDLNIARDDIFSKAPAPVITKKPVTEDIINRVIAGEFGNGANRKKALEELGYIYTEVQKAVNNKLNAPKPITEELINNVIRGRYGNGAERKKAIELMGYDYEEVRRRVNERLKG